MRRVYWYLAILLLPFMLSCAKELPVPEVKAEEPPGVLVRMPKLPPGLYYEEPCTIIQAPFGYIGACLIVEGQKVSYARKLIR